MNIFLPFKKSLCCANCVVRWYQDWIPDKGAACCEIRAETWLCRCPLYAGAGLGRWPSCLCLSHLLLVHLLSLCISPPNIHLEQSALSVPELELRSTISVIPASDFVIRFIASIDWCVKNNAFILLRISVVRTWYILELTTCTLIYWKIRFCECCCYRESRIKY